jgi:hypothetical protein
MHRFDKRHSLIFEQLCLLHKQFYQAFDIEDYNQAFKSVILQNLGNHELSENVQAVEFGFDRSVNAADTLRYGFKIREKPYTFLSAMLGRLMVMPVPEDLEFRDYFPDLTQEEWQAAMYICSTILSAFELHKSLEEPTEQE